MDLNAVVAAHVLEVARSLRSDNGENLEYDRALVEMTRDLLGFLPDDRAQVAALVLEG